MSQLSELLVFGSLFVVLIPLYGLLRLINWMARRTIAPTWLPLVLGVGILFGGSLYLDATGLPAIATVVRKTDEIIVNSSSRWRRELTISLEYTSPGDPKPTRLIFACNPQTFDGLRVGAVAPIKLVEYGRYLRFGRLEQQSTRTVFTDRLPRLPRGPWLEATAIVTSVLHVSELRWRGSNGAVVVPLKWPYDIAQLQFLPDDRSEPITAVHVVESASVPKLHQGATVKVKYPADHPRQARIIGARSGSEIKNVLYYFAVQVTLVFILFGSAGYWWRRRKKSQQRARAI